MTSQAMEWSLFDEVGDALRSMLPSELGELNLRARRYGIKVWFAEPREHYEAQVIGADAVDDARTLALEVGFHAEHPQVGDNDAVLARLAGREKQWRAELGADAVAGPFLGRAQVWRRVSETWPDPDLSDPELALELAARLATYITVLEPARRDA